MFTTSCGSLCKYEDVISSEYHLTSNKKRFEDQIKVRRSDKKLEDQIKIEVKC